MASTAQTESTRDAGQWPRIVTDRASRVPLYFQIAEALRRQIENGELEVGSLLGNEIQFAARLGVSRPTMREAIQMLAEQGLVARRRGIGTVVLPNPVKRRSAIPSLFEDLKTRGRRPTTRVLSMEIAAAAAPDVLSSLGLESGTDTVALSRVRFADDAPLAVMNNWLPSDLIDPAEIELEQHGLYEVLRSVGVIPHVVDETIAARHAGMRDGQLLDIPARDVVLTLAVVAYDAAGRAIDVGRHVFRADRYSFEIRHVNQ